MTNDLEELKNKEFKILDKGYVMLVDYMGNDDSIIQAARVSYGKGTKKVSEDRGLIRYLMRHDHTTPFEMVEFKFHCKMPIFVAREWIRHRTANVNEYSLRYSEPEFDFYIPDLNNIGAQSKSNKQGRTNEAVTEELGNEFIKDLTRISEETSKIYKDYSDKGIARELCRMFLPVDLYTRWFWKIDLHNLFHFLELRMNQRAQYEIRQYANTMYNEIVKKIVPIAAEAFEDYKLNSTNLSKLEIKALDLILEGKEIEKACEESGFLKGRELNEFKDKLEIILKKENVSR